MREAGLGVKEKLTARYCGRHKVPQKGNLSQGVTACGRRVVYPCAAGKAGKWLKFDWNWARLIQKIYETDPLCCPRCSGKMKVISVIGDEEVIKKILKHLGLWEIKQRPPPKPAEYSIDYSVSQVPPSDTNVGYPTLVSEKPWKILPVSLICGLGSGRGKSLIWERKVLSGSAEKVYDPFFERQKWNRMRGLFLLDRGLFIFPQLVYE
jgi:hypothetical protein